jgi:hypothetical protein
MEDELKKIMAAGTTIVVRVERAQSTEKVSSLRKSSEKLLRSVSGADPPSEAVMVNQLYRIKQAIQPVDAAETAVAERVFRDTDHLLLRSSDVTLATTSSHIIEEMIADGDQFDWVIVEEAARANGAELIGALLLGNRRVMVGDHNQLSPFDAVQRQKFYDTTRAAELLRDAKKQLETISDLPPEVILRLRSGFTRGDVANFCNLLASAKFAHTISPECSLSGEGLLPSPNDDHEALQLSVQNLVLPLFSVGQAGDRLVRNFHG